ncbi:MAG TPA: hypothetical protein VGR07_14365 [Thermoanaerobaculia bacterium]|nr:hypothetical protein [Thermoanaerobaculia bacterium]
MTSPGSVPRSVKTWALAAPPYQLDLGDPERPRLRCGVEELERI